MRTNRGKRLYVFGAVALAVFVFLLTLTGILCNGFATADRVKAAREAELGRIDAELLNRAKTELGVAEIATAAALDKYQAIHQEFTSFLSEHFTELMKQDSEHAAEETAAKSPAQNKPDENAVQRPTPNPAWEKANQQLAELQRRRTELLTNFTESHPLVRQMEIAIRDVESQLNRISTQADERRKREEQPPMAVVAKSVKNWQPVDEEYRSLIKNVDAAENSYQLALKHERSQRQDFERLSAAAKTAPVQLVTAGGANPRLSIYLCGLVALAAGVLVARWSRIPESTFQSAADVRQSLDTTVLGVIPRNPHVVPRERPRHESRWVRRILLASELLLTAAVAVLAVSAIADRQFLFDLIVDPLSACSNKFWC